MTTATAPTVTSDLDAPIWVGCGKCSGSGTVSWGVDVSAVFTNEAGRIVRTVPRVCFDCGGRGGKSTTQRKLNANEKARARAAVKREAARVARFEAAQAEEAAAAAAVAVLRADFETANPAITAVLAGLTGEFADSLRAKLDRDGTLTEGQMLALAKIGAEKAAEPASAPVVTGRIVVCGKVVSTKRVETGFGWTTKMVVLDDRGFKVFGSMPSPLNVDKGDRVSFTATVERSEGDEAFGFYSRPTKASYLGSPED